MQTKTVNGAKDILLVAQNLLKASGRPRKPLGKPRPQAVGHAYGSTKFSLVGALTAAANIVGATRTQLTAAMDATIDAAWDSTGGVFYRFGDTPRQNVQHYDDMELDTRETIRTLARASKHYL